MCGGGQQVGSNAAERVGCADVISMLACSAPVSGSCACQHGLCNSQEVAVAEQHVHGILQLPQATSHHASSWLAVVAATALLPVHAMHDSTLHLHTVVTPLTQITADCTYHHTRLCVPVTASDTHISANADSPPVCPAGGCVGSGCLQAGVGGSTA